MSDKYFLDTNILIYLYSDDEPEKALISRNLPFNSCIASTQCLTEISNVLLKKYKKGFPEVKLILDELTENIEIVQVTTINIQSALKIAEKLKYSFFDSLIVAVALEQQCTILYTEDLHNSHCIDDRMTIINPYNKLQLGAKG